MSIAVQDVSLEISDQLEQTPVSAVPQRAQPDKFWWLAAALTATTIYDVETTFHGLKQCNGCSEKSPLGRFLVDRGRFVTYTAQFAVNAGFLLLAKTKGEGWTAAALVIAAGHLAAGTWNLRFVF